MTYNQTQELKAALALAYSIFNPIADAYQTDVSAWEDKHPETATNAFAHFQSADAPQYSSEYKAAQTLVALARKALNDHRQSIVDQINDPVD